MGERNRAKAEALYGFIDASDYYRNPVALDARSWMNVPFLQARPELDKTFVTEATDPGFSVGQKERKMGIKGSPTCEIYFQDCRIPVGRLIGEEGQGFKTALKTLDHTRLGIGAQASTVRALREDGWLVPRTLPDVLPDGRGFQPEGGVEVQVAVLDGPVTGQGQAAALAAIGAAATARDVTVPRSRRPFRIDVLPASLTYAAAADLAKWDRAALERSPVAP